MKPQNQSRPLPPGITEKHLREMSPERDFPGAPPVALRYAILSSPRSGSTLLGRILHATGLAGDPQEYFNPPLILLERQRTGNELLTLPAFLKAMEKRRTSPNGLFGMKMHYAQWLGAFQAQRPNDAAVGFLRSFDRLVWIRRRDRLAQGISQAIGAHTNVWSSEDSRFRKDPELNIHPYECLAATNVVAREDFGWERVIGQLKLAVHEVWYEDLVADYEAKTRGVLRHLGIEGQVQQIPAPPLEKQGGALNEKLRARVCEFLGVQER